MAGKATNGRALSDAEWEALQARAPGEGVFAVVTTGVVCRYGCAARPLRRNVRAYDRLEQAFADGFRPCKRCRPEVRASS